jgi:hypothetical protein
MAPRNWQLRFIQHLENTGQVVLSCKLAGVSKKTAYRCRARSPKFAAAWEQALERALDAIEDAAHRMALGVDLEGKTVRDPSERLVVFMLERKRPEKYGRRQMLEHSGPQGGPIQLSNATMSEAMRELTKDPEAVEAMQTITDKLAALEVERQAKALEDKQ